ncbi:CPBP family intramembrane glutamic endopeptidase [Paucibacter sp. KCTC 42545]|uniref:CPBP family intramembrane glutamic endopeptidase n=1 Tax=Paucibacter sp. KCTC 42545 TaxID=1768242 RepID=UPI000733A38C|nr:CPBP family intramembrane glutamic endopeptidase [Paucibacter sp. KCTC 42545]ALT79093.1 hypothetical protein AT984_19775 [Paucibacter sp. KCTC 42545]
MNKARAFFENFLLLIVLAAACQIIGSLLKHLFFGFVGSREWLTENFLLSIFFLVEAAILAVVLARVNRGISIGDLLKPFWLETLLISFVYSSAILVVAVACSGKNVAEISPNLINPFNPVSEYWWASFVGLLIKAFQEELLNRGVLQPLMGEMFSSEVIGLVVVAVLFTLGHPTDNFMIVFPGAVALGVVFLITKSVLSCSILHICMNISFDILFGSNFTVSPLLDSAVLENVRPVFFLVVMAMAFVHLYLKKYHHSMT